MNTRAGPGEAGALAIELGSLSRLREAVSRYAQDCGFSAAAVRDIVLIANELAANVIKHGGGTGRMWLWCHGPKLYCQVSDLGTGMTQPDRAGAALADPRTPTGRGLWIVRQMSDRVHISTGPTGTTVTVAFTK